MHRTTWGYVYGLIILGILGAVVLLGLGTATGSEPLALAGVSLCIASFAASHYVVDHRWLKDTRTALSIRERVVAQAESQIYARSAILENRTQRALREMDEVEQQRAERNEADRQTMRDEIEAERAAMHEEFETEKDEFRQNAMRVGHMLGVRGLDPKAIENMAQVITLPVGEHRSTTMGEGRIHTRQ